jgi:hypothetical protein
LAFREEHADDPSAKAFGEFLGVMDGEGHELSFSVEASFQNERVPIGVEAQHVAEGLTGDGNRASDGRSCCCLLEICDQGKDQDREVGEQPLVVAEENAKRFWNGEDELAVGEGEQELLLMAIFIR